MNYLKIEKASISNGLGFRVVLFCAGCTQRCKGCFNPESWDFEAGKPFDDKSKEFLFSQLSKPYIKGITFSGGHPVDRHNSFAVYSLIKEIREKFPSKDIWLYTGWEVSYDNFAPNYTDICIPHEVFKMCDVVVDGPYIEEQRDITLPFRGSKNQRLIDVKETLKQGQIIQYKIN